MNSNILKHLFVALATTILLILPDYIFHLFNVNYTPHFSLKNILPIFALSTLVLFVPRKSIQYTFFSFFFILSLVQFVHFNFFGGLISPHGIILFFSEFGEIAETLRSMSLVMINPLVSIIAPFIALIYILTRYQNILVKTKISHIVLVLLLIVLPMKAYFADGSKRFEADIKSLAMKNTFLSLSFFLGKDLPQALFGSKELKSQKNHQNYRVNITPIDPKKHVNVVMIMGESLSYKRLSLFGYERKTTPLLDALRTDENFVYKKAIAASIATKVSIPMFFNMQRDPDNISPLVGFKTNLVKLAKEQNFITHVYSKQDNTSIASYLPVKNIDFFKTTQNYNAPDVKDFDTDLLDYLKNIDFEKNNFVVLHQRACHSPYEKMYPLKFEKFKVDKSDFKESMSNSYDNCVTFQDNFLHEIIQTLKQKSIDPTYETLLFFVPDHAELLGEKGKFGHTILELDVAKIPFLHYGIHTDLTAKIRQFNDIPTHFEVSRFVANALNVEVIDPNDDNQTVFINGNDLNGKKGLMSYTKKEILEQL